MGCLLVLFGMLSTTIIHAWEIPQQPYSILLPRRSMLASVMAAAATTITPYTAAAAVAAATTTVDDSNNMFAPSFVQQYSDFLSSPEGWSYRDVTTPSLSSTTTTSFGTSAAQWGDRVVYDWSGYTIGYFGRPFQAKGGPTGGAFDKDLEYSRTVLGSHAIVPALEQAMVGMTAGSVRQVLVPYSEKLSYPSHGDPNHDIVGPKPTTFSGQRALNFVLENPRLDQTLLFNVKLIRVDKPNGRGGFQRG